MGGWCVFLCVCVCVCVCGLSVCLSVNISLCSWVIFLYVDAVYWFSVCFLCLIGCFIMIVSTPTVFESLICTRFLLLYLHLFSANEHVSHGKAL